MASVVPFPCRPLSPSSSNIFPLLLFQPHVTFVPLGVTAICITWGCVPADGFANGWLAKRGGGFPVTRQLWRQLEWGLWVHGLFGPQK